jgi:hypothetical protein
MTLVNETGVQVQYWITCAAGADCGNIDVDGIADLPAYDNQQNVVVSFLPADGTANFSVNWPSTTTGEQAEMALVAE